MSVSAPAPPLSYAHLTRRQTVFALAGMMLTLLLAAMDQTIVGTALPRVVASLDGFDRYPWVTTSYLLSSTIALPVFAKLSDLYGRKWIYLLGISIFIASSWLCGAAGNMPLPLDGMTQLIVFRGLQGIGGGAVMGLTFTIIGDLFSPAERGRFQGMFGAIFGLASVIGPLAGGWITDHLSWRWAFYVNAPLGFLAVGVLYATFPHVPPHGRRKVIDWAGLLALCGWVVPLLLALSRVTDTGWTDAAQALMAVAVLMLAVFVVVERRATEPIIPPSLFRIRAFVLASAGVFVLGMGLFGMFVYLPLYLQVVLGLSAAASGTLFVPMVFTMIASSIVSGQVVSRTGRYKALAVVGAALAAAGLGLLAAMDPQAGTTRVLWNLALCGLGFGLAQPIYTLVVQNVAPREQLGAATASAQFFRSIGSTLGVALFGTALLGLYHRTLASAIPPGTPEAVVHLFDNPLQLTQATSRLAAELASRPDGAALQAQLLGAVRTSIADGMHLVFVAATVLMSGSVLLNVLLPEVPLRSRAEHAAASTPAA